MKTESRLNPENVHSVEDSDGNGQPTHEEISALAYRFYKQEGCPNGRAGAQWFAAEEFLKREMFAANERKSIVALVDFSDVAANVLKQAQAFAQAFKSHVTVLWGVPMSHAVVDGSMQSEQVETDLDRVQKMTEPLRTCGVDVSLKRFQGFTTYLVVEEALSIEADLIVVGSHQHNAFYNLLIDSVTHQILKRARCPVLVVPV
jgi:nucleotide-binding universal stress UspA family protein